MKFDIIRMIFFCLWETLLKECKEKPQVRRKNIFKHIPDKVFVLKIYKILLKLNNKETNNSVEKWMQDLNKHLIKDTARIENTHVKRCSTLFWIKKTQIKTTKIFLHTPIRMVKIQRADITKWGCRAIENLINR